MLYLFCQVSDLKSAFAKSLLRARTATPVFSKSHLCQPDIAFTLHLAEDTSAVSICQLVMGNWKQKKDYYYYSWDMNKWLHCFSRVINTGKQPSEDCYSIKECHCIDGPWLKTCASVITINKPTCFTDRNASEHVFSQPKVYKRDLMIDEWLLADKLSLLVLLCACWTSLIVPHCLVFFNFLFN